VFLDGFTVIIVGCNVKFVGIPVGKLVGKNVGIFVGETLGKNVGEILGFLVGELVGVCVGVAVGAIPIHCIDIRDNVDASIFQSIVTLFPVSKPVGHPGFV